MVMCDQAFRLAQTLEVREGPVTAVQLVQLQTVGPAKENLMSRIFVCLLIIAAGALNGCTNPKAAKYSCGTDVSQRTVPTMKVAPQKDAAGDPTCE